MLMKDKIALVTGGSRGIGRAISIALAAEGAKVVINFIEHSGAANETVNKIISRGGSAIALKADVSKPNEVARLVRGTIREFGYIDTLINNAGINKLDPIINITIQDWDRILDVNLKGCLLCSQFVVREMIKCGKGGRVINISSVDGFIAEPNSGAYSASKAGMIALTKCMAIEFAKFGINVNAIAPGEIETDLGVYPDNLKKGIAKRIPLGCVAQPEDVSGAAIYLASDASRYVTGQILVVDGGWMINGTILPED